MEVDIREFLSQFLAEELVDRGILRGDTRLLNNGSLRPLIELMIERNVSRLEAKDRDWFLDSDEGFQNPLFAEAKAGKMGDLDNQGSIFDLQNTSINPHYARKTGSDPDPGDEDSAELTFGLERDLQQALRSNIAQLEPGLKVMDGGTERKVEAGRIDITAEDSNGHLVVIELKAGTAELGAIAQLLSYMGSADADDHQDRPIRGILVAKDFHSRSVIAARAVPNLSLKE